MKTWEMLKIISENKGKELQFKLVSDHLNGASENEKTIIVGSFGTIKYASGQLFTVFHNVIHEWEWEKVKQSVDFITAITSERRIKPAYGNYEYDFIEFWLFRMSKENSFFARNRKEMVQGKWYIED